MSDINLVEELEKASVKISFGSAVFGLINVDGVEYVAGYRETSGVSAEEWQGLATYYPQPTSELRVESEVKNMVETALTSDILSGNDYRVYAILMGVDAFFFALGEGLIVDNEIHFIDGFYVGRILALGRVWKLNVQLDESILPNTFSVATVDSNLNFVE